MNVISIVATIGKDISSRARAADLRHEILRLAGTADTVVLDFLGVRTISDSFADELFGVLIEDRGELWFCEHVQVANVAPLPRATILGAVASRSCIC